MLNNIFLMTISAVMLFLSFPEFNQGWLIWIALVPFFINLENSKNLRQTFFLGGLFGFIFFAGLVYWILIFTIFALLALNTFLALYIAIFSVLIFLVKKRTKSFFLRIFFPAFLWVSLEYLHSLGKFAFTWGGLGYSQWNNLPLIQITNITGPYGVSFLIVLVNSFLAELFISREKLNKETYSCGLVIVILIISVYLYGLNSIPERMKEGNVKVAIIQGDVPRFINLEQFALKDALSTYENLTREIISYKPDLVVWPESAIPYFLLQNKFVWPRIKNLAKEIKSNLLIGAWGKDKENVYNSAFVVSPSGKILGRYDKVQLVLFSETVPFKKFFMEKLNFNPWGYKDGEDKDFSPGKGFFPIKTNLGKLGIVICFESTFPQIARKICQRGAKIIIVITNDSWFQESSAAFQHLTFSIFRAIENRTYIIRAASTGISCFIDPYGRILKTSDMFQTKILKGKIEKRKEKTFYTKNGDVFSIFCLIISLIIISIQIKYLN